MGTGIQAFALLGQKEPITGDGRIVPVAVKGNFLASCYRKQGRAGRVFDDQVMRLYAKHGNGSLPGNARATSVTDRYGSVCRQRSGRKVIDGNKVASIDGSIGVGKGRGSGIQC